MRFNLQVPKELNLDSWWNDAFCKGMKAEQVKRDHCWNCPVQWECLWDAIKLDDRIGDHAMFVRGGVLANKREELWYWTERDVYETYLTCKVEAERTRFAQQRKQKTGRDK